MDKSIELVKYHEEFVPNNGLRSSAISPPSSSLPPEPVCRTTLSTPIWPPLGKITSNQFLFLLSAPVLVLPVDCLSLLRLLQHRIIFFVSTTSPQINCISITVPTTATTAVERVMVLTWQPNGRARSSHLSRSPSGQISALSTGARMGKCGEGFGTQADDCTSQSVVERDKNKTKRNR